MSKERARRREQRQAEAQARAAKLAKQKPRQPKHPRPRRRRRLGHTAIGARPWSQRFTIAAMFVLVQFVVWQFISDAAGRFAAVVIGLVLLPVFVVLVFDRRKAP